MKYSKIKRDEIQSHHVFFLVFFSHDILIACSVKLIIVLSKAR